MGIRSSEVQRLLQDVVVEWTRAEAKGEEEGSVGF